MATRNMIIRVIDKTDLRTSNHFHMCYGVEPWESLSFHVNRFTDDSFDEFDCEGRMRVRSWEKQTKSNFVKVKIEQRKTVEKFKWLRSDGCGTELFWLRVVEKEPAIAT